jgi:hypothetical protein
MAKSGRQWKIPELQGFAGLKCAASESRFGGYGAAHTRYVVEAGDVRRVGAHPMPMPNFGYFCEYRPQTLAF